MSINQFKVVANLKTKNRQIYAFEQFVSVSDTAAFETQPTRDKFLSSGETSSEKASSPSCGGCAREKYAKFTRSTQRKFTAIINLQTKVT